MSGEHLRIGIDIGGTKTAGVAIDRAGSVQGLATVPTETEPGGAVRSALAVVSVLRDQLGELPSGSIGVGVPGLVDTARGMVSHAVNLGIDGTPLPLADLLAARLDRRVVVDNDVNAAALGAVAVTGRHDLAYLNVGTRLAAGFVLDGRLRRGAQGAAGEIGHVQVDPAGESCRCGRRGCLETMASGAALLRAEQDRGLPAHVAFTSTYALDDGAAQVRERFASAVASAVVLVALAVDVEAIVLGGGAVGDGLRADVAEALRHLGANAPFIAALSLVERLTVLPAGQPVSAIGAAMLEAVGQPPLPTGSWEKSQPSWAAWVRTAWSADQPG